MRVHEYLTKIGITKDSCKDICFVIGKVFGNKNNKEIFYKSTPMRTSQEWYYNFDASDENKVLNYHVLNTKQNVTYFLSGVNWNPSIDSGRTISLLVMSSEELEKAFGPYWKSTIDFIDKEIEKLLSNKENKTLGRVGMPYGK